MNPQTDAPATPDAGTMTPDAGTIQVSTAGPDGAVVTAPVAPVGGQGPQVEAPRGETQQEALGVGTEGEETVWTARYSFKNFVGRISLRILVTVGWLLMLSYLGNQEHYPGRLDWRIFVWITGAAIAIYWGMLAWQITMGRLGHFYELTNRRLFIETGVFRRRRDQMELLKVQDVYVKQQGLVHRLMNLGTVVIESSEERLPIHYLAGVDEPNVVMDRIWKYARTERDMRSVKVDQV
jgi:membrane protein YdbS with pleckstrin-like domain